MATHRKLTVLLSIIAPFSFLLLLLILFFLFYFYRSKRSPTKSIETPFSPGPETETLIKFSGGEYLTIHEILDAPGEVVGKSSYGTLYRAGFVKTGSFMMLRFIRPACVGNVDDIEKTVRVIGSIRDPNLVELRAMYVGPRGEILFIYPFFGGGNLAQFLKDGKAESHRWDIIYKLSLGIARGLDHLHNNLPNPIIHGNLKSKNVLIDSDHQPRLSDFSLHSILNPASSQEMLDSSTSQCYKAPELLKMKDASKETDIFNLGVIFLEILTRKDSTDLHLPPSLKTNLFIENKISETLAEGENSTVEERLVKLFHLAMACCSPSPVLRPNIKQVIRELEEL